jgi:hypothetical protein
VPAAALTALEPICGPLELQRLFVLPRTTRLVDPTHCVVTPDEVVGFGDDVVGVWIDDGPDGRVLSLPVERLMAVDDRTILLFGRLRLIAGDAQLVVRYNTVARGAVSENVSALRRRMATRALPVEPGFVWTDPRGEPAGPSALPHKWRLVLEHPTVRPNRGEDVSIAVGDLGEIRGRRTRPLSGLAVLGSRELVIALEPSEYLDAQRFGVDTLAVPRDRLSSLSWDGRTLTVLFGGERRGVDSGAVLMSPVDRSLVEAMRTAFGAAVRWS